MARQSWTDRVEALEPAAKAEFARRMHRVRPDGLAPAIAALKARLIADPQTIATRKAGELALEAITAIMPELVIGSADLTPSNNTRTKSAVAITPGDYAGRYIHYGIREHAMSAAMNGIAIHGGFVPAGATFLVFSDYARPAIRIAALAGIPVVFVMTHDSIGLGEDGPTHQPVEHLAALRAMPNLQVFPPGRCDRNGGVLAACAGAHRRPLAPRAHPPERRSAPNGCRGGQPLRRRRLRTPVRRGRAPRHTVRVGLGGRDRGRREGAARRQGHGDTRRVGALPRHASAPAGRRPPHRRRACARAGRHRGGSPFRLGRGHRPDGIFVGMTGFGASAPYKDLYAISASRRRPWWNGC
jgi:transketolase